MHQLYFSSSQEPLSCRYYMRQGFTEGKALKCTALKKTTPTRPQLPDFARSMGFVSQSWINMSPPLAANNLHSLAFVPSLILLADLQVLVQRFLIFSLPCQKDCWDWQRSSELRRQRRASAAGFLAGPDFLLHLLIAQQCKQVENKQLLLGGGLRAYLNYLEKRSPSETPIFLIENALKICNERKESRRGFCTEAAVIQKHKFEVILKLFHNPSHNL